MTDTLLGFVPHPLSIVADILSKTLSTFPALVHLRFLVLSIWIHRRLTSKLRWYLNHRLVDQHRDRV